MKQEYHTNAVTNIHIRKQIKTSLLKNFELAKAYKTSVTTVSKWRNRQELLDKSSRPNKIQYALNEFEQGLAISIRKTTWLPLDEVWETLLEVNPNITRSSVYRTFCRHQINIAPQNKKENDRKKFKEYEPGYIHVDVTYLPKFDKQKNYLFVAIDRATRTLFYKVYDAKTSDNTEDFMRCCLEYFPFTITHVLTDNGLEFTNRLIKSKKGKHCLKPSKLDQMCMLYKIKHRLTKPNTPKTNGMVERVNATIKNATILKENYTGKTQMNESLMSFLVYYMIYKRHGGLRRELNVKTPLQAIEKWFEIKPEIFNQNPSDFKNKILSLKSNFETSVLQQRCET
jgi:transposase-like protein